MCLCVCPSESVYVSGPEDGRGGIKAGETLELLMVCEMVQRVHARRMRAAKCVSFKSYVSFIGLFCKRDL